MARWIGLAAPLAAALVCMRASADVGLARSPLIYGADDRRDVYSISDTSWRALALETSLALVHPDDLLRLQDGEVAFDAPSFREAYGLCPSERFSEQPALAQCTGVLVDDDLLLTAAHCLERSALSCDKQLWVFDYALQQPSDPPQLRADSVFACRSVPLQRHSSAPDQRLDFAFVQLDRPVPGRRAAATLATSEPLAGDRVCVIGYPSGLPAKIDCGAEVIADRSDYLSLTSDTFAGSSGSGVFDLQRRLAAVLTRGAGDYEPARDGRRCRVARTVDHVSAADVLEQASYVAPAVRALCASGWKSERLCGAASECGDGQCSSDEHTTCRQDCPKLAVWSTVRAAESCAAAPPGTRRRAASPKLLLGCACCLAYARRRVRLRA